MRLSIIVPVYNVEKYIEECLESLLALKIYDMEIILVNDGSTDNSLEIIKKYNDKRIIIINQTNSGLSAARNTGLKKATGEFILFVDSDDYIINQDKFEEILSLAKSEKYDILIGNGYREYPNKIRREIKRNKRIYNKDVYYGSEYIKETMRCNSFIQVVWLNIYRREFLLDNNLFFKEGINHEDLNFSPQAFIAAKRIGLTKNSFYIYRQRENSITTSKNQSKNARDIFDTVKELSEKLNSEDKQLNKALNLLYTHVLFEAILKAYDDEELVTNIIKYMSNDKYKNNIQGLKNKISINMFKINKKNGYKYLNFRKNLKKKIKKIIRR